MTELKLEDVVRSFCIDPCGELPGFDATTLRDGGRWLRCGDVQIRTFTDKLSITIENRRRYEVDPEPSLVHLGSHLFRDPCLVVIDQLSEHITGWNGGYPVLPVDGQLCSFRARLGYKNVPEPLDGSWFFDQLWVDLDRAFTTFDSRPPDFGWMYRMPPDDRSLWRSAEQE